MKQLLIVALVSLMAFSVQAKHHKGMHKMGKMGHMGKIMKELNLTDEQQTKLKEMREAKQKNMAEMRSKMMEARNALLDGWKSQADDSKMKSLHEAFHDVKRQMMQANFEHRLAIRALLTDEQKKTFAEKIGSMRMGKGQ